MSAALVSPLRHSLAIFYDNYWRYGGLLVSIVEKQRLQIRQIFNGKPVVAVFDLDTGAFMARNRLLGSQAPGMALLVSWYPPRRYRAI